MSDFWFIVGGFVFGFAVAAVFAETMAVKYRNWVRNFDED